MNARRRIAALQRWDQGADDGMYPNDEGDYLDRDQVLLAVSERATREPQGVSPAEMVRAWRDLDRRVLAEEITTAKAAELFVAEFGPFRAASLPAPTPDK
jgi:hypothetical protein